MPTQSLKAVTMDVVMHMFPEPSSRKNVSNYFNYVRNALEKQGITSPEMHLVAYATIRAESAGFAPISEKKSKYNTKTVTELIIPVEYKGGGSMKLAKPMEINLYDGRTDLGNTVIGDGAKYMGRGFVQLTGKVNYHEFGAKLGRHDLLGNPELANEPEIAANVLALYLAKHKSRIEKAIKRGDLAEIRKAVNGGSHGLDNFVEAYTKGYGKIQGDASNALP